MLRSLMILAVMMTTATAWVLADDAGPLARVFTDDFERGADRWQPTDPDAWRIVELDRGKVYNQFQQSNYRPPHRSPYNVALVKDVLVSDFVLTVDLQSTNVKAGNHRDMCVFFGYQDPANFYYVHLGLRPDPHSSQIMRVDDGPRVMITKNQSPGIPWSEGWHKVKVVRRTEDGTIEVYFDNLNKPVMVARDKTFVWGQVGIGSFDDHGNWDHFQLHGKLVQRPPAK